MPLPDFTSPTTFPPFTALPLTTTTTTPSQDPPAPHDKEEPYYLLAQITDNMTLTKPTLILSDATSTPFALTFASRPGAGPDTLDFAKLGYKKGATLVVPRAKRTPPKQQQQQQQQQGDGTQDQEGGGGGKGFVAVERAEEGGVRVIAGALGKVLEVGGRLRERDREREQQGEGGGGKQRGCETCGKGEGEGKGGLMKCTGCGEVAYCSKVSLLTF